MTQRRSQTRLIDIQPDPLAEAVFTDSQGIAGDLEAVLTAIAGYDHSSIKAILFRKPAAGIGPFEWIEDVPAPIDMTAVMTSLKARFGGGSYRAQIFAGGKTRKQIEFSIMGPPVAPGSVPAAPDPFGGGDMFKFMILQQQQQQQRDDAARREQQEDMRRMMERQENAANRQKELIVTLAAAALPALIPVLSGANREKLSDLVALLQLNKPPTVSMKEQIETLTLLRGLTTKDDSEGFDPENMVASLGRMAGPALAAAGRAFGGGRNGGGAAGPAEEPAGQMLYLPEPEPPAAPAPIAAAPASTGSPILDLIRPHVLYFFNAHLPVDLAADAIADIMQREGVAGDDLNGLVAAFTLSPDWKTDLAAQGIDLRSDPEWADEFLAELVAAWTDAERNGDGGRGGEGGAADAPDHAIPRAGRVKVNGHSRPGAGADH